MRNILIFNIKIRRIFLFKPIYFLRNFSGRITFNLHVKVDSVCGNGEGASIITRARTLYHP